MEPAYTFTKHQITKIFERWNRQAAEGNWTQRDDPEASAEHFIATAADLQLESDHPD